MSTGGHPGGDPKRPAGSQRLAAGEPALCHFAQSVSDQFGDASLPETWRRRGMTLYVQRECPGTDDGPFFAGLRLYWPKPSVW